MTVLERVSGSLAVGGVPLDRAFASLRRLEPHAHGGYVYDLERLEGRARRFRAAFAPLSALSAFALKANSLPAILECLKRSGMGGEAGSLGELELAGAAGFGPDERILNGNGRTLEEAEWVAGHGVHSVNADHVDELDLLQRAAARAGVDAKDRRHRLPGATNGTSTSSTTRPTVSSPAEPTCPPSPNCSSTRERSSRS